MKKHTFKKERPNEDNIELDNQNSIEEKKETVQNENVKLSTNQNWIILDPKMPRGRRLVRSGDIFEVNAALAEKLLTTHPKVFQKIE